MAMTNEQCSECGSLYSHLTWLYGFTSTDSSSHVTCVIMDVLSMNAFKLSPNDQSFPHNQCSFVFTSKCSTLNRTVTKNYGLSETPGAFWLTENILRTVVIGANDLIFSIIWSLCMCALWNSKPTWHFYLIFRDFHAFRARKKTSTLEQIYCFTQANIYLTKVSLKQKRNISVYINFSWWPGCTRHTHVHAHALLKLRKPIVKT